MSIASTAVYRYDNDFVSREKKEVGRGIGKALSLEKEFSVASLLTKTIKSSLTPDMSNICESYASTRLTAKFRGLAKFADGKSGSRPFLLTKFGEKMKGFDFNSDSPYKKAFKAKYYVKSGSRKGQIILHFPAFIPAKDTKAPEIATNFKISARLIAISDFGFDNVEQVYRQLNKEHHGRYASFESGMLPILKMPVDPITTQLSLDQKELPDNTSLFLLMSISFYRFEQGRFKHLSKESAMHLEQVF